MMHGTINIKYTTQPLPSQSEENQDITMTAGCRQSLTLGTLRIQRRVCTPLRVSMPHVSVKYWEGTDSFARFTSKTTQRVSIKFGTASRYNDQATGRTTEECSSLLGRQQVFVFFFHYYYFKFYDASIPALGGPSSFILQRCRWLFLRGYSGSDMQMTTPPYSNGVRYKIILSQLYMDSQPKCVTVRCRKGLITQKPLVYTQHEVVNCTQHRLILPRYELTQRTCISRTSCIRGPQ